MDPITSLGGGQYPLPAIATLRKAFVGKDIRSIKAPAAILDVAKLRRNCLAQLKAVDHLGLSFRVHCKTHKTVELTALQVGEESHRPVRLVVSTLPEAEILLPWLKQCKANGRSVNVLYGIPPSSCTLQLFEPLRHQLGPHSISFLLDHPAQIANLVNLQDLHDSSKDVIPIFIKIDTGYHRAGISAATQEFTTLLQAISQHARPDSSAPRLKLVGLYSHLGNSYEARSTKESLQFLIDELQRGHDAIKAVLESELPLGLDDGELLTLSVGATPQVTAAQNLFGKSEEADGVQSALKRLRKDCIVELHAGNYSVLDVQQFDTHARPQLPEPGAAIDVSLNKSDIAGYVMAEVLSLYPERSPKQALIGAGVLALGREPANYPGWAVVAPSPWRESSERELGDADMNDTGWIVGKIAQEHGVLFWKGSQDNFRELRVGENILLWPNHACIAGAGFPFYYIIDSDLVPTEVQDIWIRARGW